MVVDLQEPLGLAPGRAADFASDYYLRFHKTFNRMGGELRYLSADNRAFLLGLAHELRNALAGVDAAERARWAQRGRPRVLFRDPEVAR